MAAKHGSLPKSTEESRAFAREKAIYARQCRAKFKDEIHSGKYTLTEAVDVARADSVLKRIPVRELLRSFVGMGPKKVENAMISAKIANNRRVSGLSDNQLNRLLEWFSARIRR